jgi:hypothetical protein
VHRLGEMEGFDYWGVVSMDQEHNGNRIKNLVKQCNWFSSRTFNIRKYSYCSSVVKSIEDIDRHVKIKIAIGSQILHDLVNKGGGIKELKNETNELKETVYRPSFN